MGIEENKELVRRYFEAGGQNDLTIWDQVCAPSMTLSSGFGGTVKGLDTVKQFTAALHGAFSDFYLRVEDVVAEGDEVAVEWTTGGTHSGPLPAPTGMIPATDKTMTLPGMSFLRIAGGKIVEERVQADLFGALQQLGIVPLAGQMGA